MDRNQKLFIVYNEGSLAFIDTCGVNASFYVTELNISKFLFLAVDKGGFNEGAGQNQNSSLSHYCVPCAKPCPIGFKLISNSD